MLIWRKESILPSSFCFYLTFFNKNPPFFLKMHESEKIKKCRKFFLTSLEKFFYFCIEDRKKKLHIKHEDNPRYQNLNFSKNRKTLFLKKKPSEHFKFWILNFDYRQKKKVFLLFFAKRKIRDTLFILFFISF